MYKGACINPELMTLMAETGHTDSICVTDAGFPIPPQVKRVDLAWRRGQPLWLDVCRLIGEEMAIEKIFLAEDIVDKSPGQYEAFIKMFPGVPIEMVTHEELKSRSGGVRGVVRTGECTSFCNCIFVAGVVF